MLRQEDGREAVLVVDQRVKGISALLFTAKAAHFVNVADHRYYYWRLMREVVAMILEKRVPMPWDETLELIRVLDGAQKPAEG